LPLESQQGGRSELQADQEKAEGEMNSRILIRKLRIFS
jgi:hypothetical protein